MFDYKDRDPLLRKPHRFMASFLHQRQDAQKLPSIGTSLLGQYQGITRSKMTFDLGKCDKWVVDVRHGGTLNYLRDISCQYNLNPPT